MVGTSVLQVLAKNSCLDKADWAEQHCYDGKPLSIDQQSIADLVKI
jgi:hypothetical protein